MTQSALRPISCSRKTPMKNSKVLKTILFLLGLALIVLGSWRLTMPVEFFAFSGIDLGNDASMLSEARATGGVVVGTGILIMLGAFFSKLTFTSTLLTAVVFLSFGFARLLGIAIDGMPGPEIVQGIIFEFVFGILGVLAFIKYRKK